MKISKKDSIVRKVDDSLSIVAMFNGDKFSFDFVIGELSGDHPKLINEVSDRIYYILEGTGIVHVDENSYEVDKDDLIIIKAKQIHGLNGKMKYIIITSPPFDPKNERTV